MKAGATLRDKQASQVQTKATELPARRAIRSVGTSSAVEGLVGGLILEEQSSCLFAIEDLPPGLRPRLSI